MARRNFPRSTFDSINVTPLIDTLFFLLIIFMVTAPLLEYTVEVSPPQMNADPMKPDEDSKIVNVKANGEIIFERRVVTADELVRMLSAIPKTGNPKPVFLRADGALCRKTPRSAEMFRHFIRIRNSARGLPPGW